jgi:hypothetical protein
MVSTKCLQVFVAECGGSVFVGLVTSSVITNVISTYVSAEAEREMFYWIFDAEIKDVYLLQVVE